VDLIMDHDGSFFFGEDRWIRFAYNTFTYHIFFCVAAVPLTSSTMKLEYTTIQYVQYRIRNTQNVTSSRFFFLFNSCDLYLRSNKGNIMANRYVVL
jgi:hypothetical protein